MLSFEGFKLNNVLNNVHCFSIYLALRVMSSRMNAAVQISGLRTPTRCMFYFKIELRSHIFYKLAKLNEIHEKWKFVSNWKRYKIMLFDG